MTNLTLTYANLTQDSDDPQRMVKTSNYKTVLVSTQDNNGSSIPCIYFFPNEVELPEEIKDGKFHMRNFDKTNQELMSWMAKMAQHKIQVDTYINFVDNNINNKSYNVVPMNKQTNGDDLLTQLNGLRNVLIAYPEDNEYTGYENFMTTLIERCSEFMDLKLEYETLTGQEYDVDFDNFGSYNKWHYEWLMYNACIQMTPLYMQHYKYDSEVYRIMTGKAFNPYDVTILQDKLAQTELDIFNCDDKAQINSLLSNHHVITDLLTKLRYQLKYGKHYDNYM
jgi:hypothetical protein